MSENGSMGAAAMPPHATLAQMMTGYVVSQAIYVVAKLGVADLLVDGPLGVEKLAAQTNSHAPTLYRVLCALASVGVFAEAAPGRFALTPMAALLSSGTPDSMRAAVIINEDMYRAWGDVLHSVRTGETAFDHLHGMGYFDYLARHPESDRLFNEAMVTRTNQMADSVVAAYDFSPFGTVVDVGGGYGRCWRPSSAATRRRAGSSSTCPTWSPRPPRR